MEDVSIWLILAPALVLSLCVHEYAHGRVASWLGDDTAREAGRLTLNPLAHADLTGSLLLPALCIAAGSPVIGWARPVPVDSRRFRRPVLDMAWVAFAGPASNLVLAGLAAALAGAMVRWLPDTTGTAWATTAALLFARVNLTLAFFNLLPLPPLDGFRIARVLLPERLGARLERIERQLGLALLAVLLLVPGALSVVSVPTRETFRWLLELVLPPSP